MSIHKAIVPLDNFVQNGDLTLEELKASVKAVNNNENPGVADIVRDPATGKLVQVTMTFPDTASTNAVTAINDHAGVAGTVTDLPEQLLLDDLYDTDGIAFSGTMEQSDRNILSVYTEPYVGIFGRYTEPTGYTDYSELTSAAPSILQITVQFNATTDFVVNSGEIVLNLSATQSLPIVLTNPLTISPALTQNQDTEWWIDSDGKIYLHQSVLAGVKIGPYTYAQAVANGAQ